MRDYGPTLLRVSLSLVFVWFGLLKLAGQSPVAKLAENLVYGVPPETFILFLGLWEVAIGVGLLVGRAMRAVLALFWLQMAGTFLILVLRPDVAFQGGNLLLLTMEGEFVIKNLVLISAGVVLGGQLRAKRLAQSSVAPVT
jgi:uncharacterized membrane protein YphA (DoxX/SURF4 family)